MNPIPPDSIDNVAEDGVDLLAAMENWKKFIAKKTAAAYFTTSRTAMALPLLAYAGAIDAPAIKPVYPLNDNVILATVVSSAAPVLQESAPTIYMTTGDIVDPGFGNA